MIGNLVFLIDFVTLITSHKFETEHYILKPFSPFSFNIFTYPDTYIYIYIYICVCVCVKNFVVVVDPKREKNILK